MTSGTVSGLATSVTYCLAVQAWNLTGGSPLSSTVLATTVTAVPSAPTNLTSPSQSLNAIALNWSRSPGAILNYTIYVGLVCGTWGFTESVGNVSMFTVGGLNSSTTYCFAVSAWNSLGQSALSTTLNATTTSPTHNGNQPPSHTNMTPIQQIATVIGANLVYVELLFGIAFLLGGIVLLARDKMWGALPLVFGILLILAAMLGLR